jgi:hypothetical protein
MFDDLILELVPSDLQDTFALADAELRRVNLFEVLRLNFQKIPQNLHEDQ